MLRAPATGISRRWRRAFLRNLEGYLFASPVILGLLFFTLVPFLAALYLSFTSYDLLSNPIWRGLRNYRYLLQDDTFRQSLEITIKYSALAVPLMLATGLALALLLNQRLRGIGLFRTLFYLPSVIPVVASAALFVWLLDPGFGAVNALLQAAHLPKGQWFSSPDSVLPSMVLLSLWGVGGGMVVYLAGLQGIPEQYYEAAMIDGAGPWSRFRNVTLPLLSPTMFYQLVLNLIASLTFFTQAYVISSSLGGSGNYIGFPENSTLFLTVYIYQNAFVWNIMGRACAMAVVLFCITLLITLFVFWSARFWVFYGDDRQ